jgi:hypothetical protein
MVSASSSQFAAACSPLASPPGTGANHLLAAGEHSQRHIRMYGAGVVQFIFHRSSAANEPPSGFPFCTQNIIGIANLGAKISWNMSKDAKPNCIS